MFLNFLESNPSPSGGPRRAAFASAGEENGEDAEVEAEAADADAAADSDEDDELLENSEKVPPAISLVRSLSSRPGPGPNPWSWLLRSQKNLRRPSPRAATIPASVNCPMRVLANVTTSCGGPCGSKRDGGAAFFAFLISVPELLALKLKSFKL